MLAVDGQYPQAMIDKWNGMMQKFGEKFAEARKNDLVYYGMILEFTKAVNADDNLKTQIADFLGRIQGKNIRGF